MTAAIGCVFTFVPEGEAVGELLEELVARVLRAHHPLAHGQSLQRKSTAEW